MTVNEESGQIDERLTVLLARQGDRQAFSRLVNLYDKRLLYFVRRILGETDAVPDILQSVWLIVHRRLRKLNSLDAFRVWLYRIAHDQAVSELRKKLKRPVFVAEVETASDVNGASIDETAFENAELVHVALDRLSVDHRRVLTLRFLEDMTIDEIADDYRLQCRYHKVEVALRKTRSPSSHRGRTP